MQLALKNTTLTLLAMLMMLVVSPSAIAADNLQQICNEGDNKNSALCAGYTSSKPDSKENPLLKLLRNITDILSYLAGALAVIFVMVGGFKYITSAGDPQKAASGRQTLTYALIGLIVVVLSRILILFILGKVIT